MSFLFRITRASSSNEHLSALSKNAIEKKTRIVRGLLKAFRKTTSHDVISHTDLDFSHIISIRDRLRDNLRAEGTAKAWNIAGEHSGDLEISDILISGLSLAIEIAISGDPSGLMDLVEATGMYGCRSNIGVDWKKNMLVTAFESRCLGKFRGVSNLEAVLETATELVSEIEIFNRRILPCFSSHWHVEAIWTTAIAHSAVCCNIVRHTGVHCENLPNLTFAQLLGMVAWIEFFHEMISNTFPELTSMHRRVTHFEECTELSNIERLAWDNLLELQRLSLDEFMVRTRIQTDEWLDKVYNSEAVKNQSAEGKLITTFCEDILSFCSVQISSIRDRLSMNSEALILAVCIILSHMRSKQIQARRENVSQDLETCCAASNDLTRISAKCEGMISDLMSQIEVSEEMTAMLMTSSDDLIGIYCSDALNSARSVHFCVFVPIEEEIGGRFFDEEWERTMVNNDLAIILIRTIDDFHEDLVKYMNEFMVVKSLMSLISATVVFYVKCLLQRAVKYRKNELPCFSNVKTALHRMIGDIIVFRDYFEGLVSQMPSLKRNIEIDFEPLSTIHELLSIAAGFSVSNAEDFIFVLQKRVRDVETIKKIVSDLWHLVAPSEDRYVSELLTFVENKLMLIAPVDDVGLDDNDRAHVAGLSLAEMTFDLYLKADERI
jgi:hypothetical protein